MLFVSRKVLQWFYSHTTMKFQSRNRDAFRFKLAFVVSVQLFMIIVSISESRCFSFQVSDARDRRKRRQNRVSISESRCFSFQAVACIRSPKTTTVSISESRCFSFQAVRAGFSACLYACFNLGIEMLFVSRALPMTRRFTF